MAAAVGLGRVEPSERLAESGARGARPRDQPGTALPCLPEPVDRRVERRLAHDLRVWCARLVAGDTDQQVLDYIVARYGVFVLLDPPFAPVTWLLWLAPPVLVLGAATFCCCGRGRRPDPGVPGLDRGRVRRAEAIA